MGIYQDNYSVFLHLTVRLPVDEKQTQIANENGNVWRAAQLVTTQVRPVKAKSGESLSKKPIEPSSSSSLAAVLSGIRVASTQEQDVLAFENKLLQQRLQFLENELQEKNLVLEELTNLLDPTDSTDKKDAGGSKAWWKM